MHYTDKSGGDLDHQDEGTLYSVHSLGEPNAPLGAPGKKASARSRTVRRACDIVMRTVLIALAVSISFLGLGALVGLGIGSAINAMAGVDLHDQISLRLEPRGIDQQLAHLPPRFFTNDTHVDLNATVTVINGTVVQTVTETLGAQQTLTSLATFTETAAAEQTVSGAMGAEGVPVITVTDLQTVVVTTKVVQTVNGGTVTRVFNATQVVTRTHVDVQTEGITSTVTRYVEPVPLSEATEVASEQAFSDLTSTETQTTTLTLTPSEHFHDQDVPESSEASSHTAPGDYGMAPSLTTTTYTPTVYKTRTVTETSDDEPLSTVEAISTRSSTSTVEIDNTIFVTETAEPVCGTEKPQYITVTQTVYAEGDSPATSEAVVISSQTPEIQTLTQTQLSTLTSYYRTTLTLSLSFADEPSTFVAPVEESTAVVEATEVQTVIEVHTEVLSETAETSVASYTRTITLDGPFAGTTTIVEEITEVVTEIFTQTQTQTASETSESSSSEQTSSPEPEVATVVEGVTEVVTEVITQTQAEVETSEDFFPSATLTLTLGGNTSEETTSLEPEVATVVEEVTQVVTQVITQTQSDTTTLPGTTITQSLDVDLTEQDLTSMLESKTQAGATLTEYQTQTFTEYATQTLFTTVDGAEVVETVVTNVVVHTELVTVTYTRSAEVTNGPERSTVWVPASQSTVASALGQVGNGTYHAPNATATHVVVSGGEKRADAFPGGVALGFAMALLGLLVLF